MLECINHLLLLIDILAALGHYLKFEIGRLYILRLLIGQLLIILIVVVYRSFVSFLDIKWIVLGCQRIGDQNIIQMG